MSNNSQKIYGFYHICCFENWTEIVIEQVNSLVSSPLFPLVNEIYVCVLISDIKNNDIQILKGILPNKFTIEIIDTNFKNYEYPILKFMHQKAQNDDFYAFYFHSKGVSVNKNRRGVPFWRKELEYFLFYKHELMLKAFELNYNTYGANLRAFPIWNNPHFSGNFWFAKSSYIKTLPLIPVDINDRYFAEEWIGKNKEMHPYVPYNTFIDLYHVPLPRLFYNKTLPVRYKDIDELILFVYYKTRGFLYKKQDKE